MKQPTSGAPAAATSTPHEDLLGAADRKVSRTQLAWQQYTYDRLDELRERWLDADRPPEGVGVLSSGEHTALVLACGHEKLLRSPIVSFVLLDGWLQRWVMERRGLGHHLVGSCVGE